MYTDTSKCDILNICLQVYEPATLCALWNWTVASQNLWWRHLLAIFAAIYSKIYNAGAILRNSWRKDQTVLARERGDVRSEQVNCHKQFLAG